LQAQDHSVISAWRKTRARAREMSWDELRTRVRQGVSKRFDLVRYRSGLLPHTNEWDKPHLAAGRFFFSADERPQLVCLLREHCNGEVEKATQEAEELCRHRFRLLGYPNVDCGPEIDWHLDAVHDKRAPLSPWYKIRFLDFSVVGDHKVTWELNRHQHLVTLAKAWVLTGEEKYVAKLVRQWYAWQGANPFPLGINWASTLEVAFRSLSGLWVRFLLADCPSVPAAFERDILQALAFNGDYIERYLSTYFSPNTHLLGEATALFFIGTLCPQVPNAARWKSLGWSILLREASRQVHYDGVYFEQSLYYHVYALDFFLHARALAGRNGMEIPREFDATLKKMLDVLYTLSRAGPPHGFGDDDGGRVFNPRRNRCEHLTDPLAIGAVLFGREDLASAASLTEEALWLFGERAVSMFPECPAGPSLRAASFAAGGIYVMASSERQAQQMVIDAGSLGAGRGGHGHADALSVTVSFGGRRWLIDPGTFGYISASKERDRFRGTSAHNTLAVDGLDQATTEGPFGWSFLPSVRAERWLAGETFTMFIGSHTGYRRLPDPVLHRRFAFYLHGGFWFVRDVLEGTEQHRCEISWHFASDLRLREAGGAFIAAPAEQGKGSNPRLVLLPAQDSGWTCDLVSDELSPAYGIKEAAPVLRIGGLVPLPAECAAVIAPLLNSRDEPGNLSQIRDHGEGGCNGVRGYRYDEPEGSQYMIFSTTHGNWKLGSCTSDANFIYCRVRDGEVAHFILCDGSFAHLSGKSVFAHRRRIERFEWRDLGEGAQVFASDDVVIRSFSQDPFRSHNFAF